MNRTALNYIVLQGLHKVPLSTTLSLSLRKILPSTTHYFLLQSLHRILPSTTLYYKACTKHPPSSTLYYKACTGYFPVLLCKARTKYFPVLCTTKFARYFPVPLCTAKFAYSTSQYYFHVSNLEGPATVRTARDHIRNRRTNSHPNHGAGRAICCN